MLHNFITKILRLSTEFQLLYYFETAINHEYNVFGSVNLHYFTTNHKN